MSKEELEKSKEFLEQKEAQGENIDIEKIQSESASKPIDYEFIYKKSPGRKNWEKTTIIFKNYKITTFRPGGIRITRNSDNTLLYRITDNFKEQFYSDAKKFIKTEKTVYQPKFEIPDLEKDIKKVGNILEQLKDPLDLKDKNQFGIKRHINSSFT